jgi:hypothetical protein
LKKKIIISPVANNPIGFCVPLRTPGLLGNCAHLNLRWNSKATQTIQLHKTDATDRLPHQSPRIL